VAGKNPREAFLAIPLIYAPSEHNFNFNLDTGEIRDRQSRKNLEESCKASFRGSRDSFPPPSAGESSQRNRDAAICRGLGRD